jgi:hypothetical protein
LLLAARPADLAERRIDVRHALAPGDERPDDGEESLFDVRRTDRSCLKQGGEDGSERERGHADRGRRPAEEPPELEGTAPGSQAESGALLNRVERLMGSALHEYRDQASRTVRSYRAMARSEGWFHRRLRGRRLQKEPSRLLLSEHSRELLSAWRTRTVPVWGEPTITSTTTRSVGTTRPISIRWKTRRALPGRQRVRWAKTRSTLPLSTDPDG